MKTSTILLILCPRNIDQRLQTGSPWGVETLREPNKIYLLFRHLDTPRGYQFTASDLDSEDPVFTKVWRFSVFVICIIYLNRFCLVHVMFVKNSDYFTSIELIIHINTRHIDYLKILEDLAKLDHSAWNSLKLNCGFSPFRYQFPRIPWTGDYLFPYLKVS